MKYYSTNNPHYKATLQEAVLKGLAPDNGLFMPDKIPVLSDDFFSSFRKKSFQDIAYEVANAFVGTDIPSNRLRKIIEHTLTFDAPLVEIEKNIFTLELFHGPTLAFKDFGARFMSQVLGYFAEQINREIIILVATSGDTGSAVAHGFYNVPGIRVVILYPSGKVSALQEKQFASLGQNISAIKVAGTFDDCQRMVKNAFQDRELNSSLFLTSANSINIARLIPQMFYYFYAWSRMKNNGQVVFSVPSGNFGNLTAGLMAKRMGLPVETFIASTNINDIVPHYLSTKRFEPKPSKATISNAMDVGNPSNFSRILDLYQHDWTKITKDIKGFSFTDDETRIVVKDVFNQTGYILDPHGAVGYLGLKKFLQRSKSMSNGVFLETAHPAKFKETIEDILAKKIELPEALSSLSQKEINSLSCSVDYEVFKSIVLNT